MDIDRRELLYCNDLRSTGRGAAWLARLLWEQEVESSNLSAPNHKCRKHKGLREAAGKSPRRFFFGATPVLPCKRFLPGSHGQARFRVSGCRDTGRVRRVEWRLPKPSRSRPAIRPA